MAGNDITGASKGVYFVTASLTTAAVPLGSSTQVLTELVIQASPNNANQIVIGNEAAQGWVLVPGQEFNCPIKNPGLIYGKAAASTATYSLFGRYGD